LYVNLHNHSEYSALDGFSTCDEMAQRAAADGNPAAAITDHGTCAGHPQFQRACDKAGIKPVFGMEAYFSPDRHEKTSYKHLILLAADNQGLKDLWAASTEAYVTGHHNKPRIDWELLERYGSHWYVTSACLGGPVSDMLREGRWGEAGEFLTRAQKILGDRFYLELQPNMLPGQIQLNRLLVQVGDALGIPLIAASDSHYPAADQKALHLLWMPPRPDDYWQYEHIHTEAEARQILLSHGLGPAVVDTAIANTARIAEACNARIEGQAPPPVFTRGGTHEDDARHLLDLCLAAWDKVPDDGEHRDRLEYEWRMVADKKMAGCYLMVWDVIGWTKAQGQLVGPGRGSAAGSLMSYLLDITTMNPIHAGLMFERFLTPGRTSLPDFDMDYASSFRDPVTDYMIRRYGDGNVIKVGTHTRYRNKGILNRLFKIMYHQSPVEWQGEAKAVAAIIDEAESHTAGLGLPWDEVTGLPEIQELAAKYEAVFTAASQMVGRLYTYGQHPGGLVVSTDASLAESLPMRTNDKGILVSQFDYRDMERYGFKLDFLTLRTMDVVQEAVELIRRRTGRSIDPTAWDDEHADPQVWAGIGTGHTAGLFQVETSLGAQACSRMKPTSLRDLAALIAYIRPGPRNSGLDERFLARRAGDEEVTYPHAALAAALESTFGVMLYQEDVLAACTILAGYDGAKADGVRKILGKKLKDKVDEAGCEFVKACVERGYEEETVSALWDQMAEFGKYGFNRSHAYAYATLAYWTAWLKEHYPVELVTAILTTLKDDKDRMAGYATEARRLGVRILPPDARFCGPSFQAEGTAIRYGLSSIPKVGPQAVRMIVAGQPYGDFDDFRARSGVDAGVMLALARAGALDALVPSRRALVRMLEADRDGSATRCGFKDERVTNAPNGLPCTFDWSTDLPIPRVGKSGRELKPRVLKPPRRCTVACRHYDPPGVLTLDGPDYAPRELYVMEQETYGCWMNDAVFAQIDKLFGEGTREQVRQFALGLPTWGKGTYPLVGVYAGTRAYTTKNGKPMWRVQVATEVSSLSIIIFEPRGDDPDLYSQLRWAKQGSLIAMDVAKDFYHKTGRGWQTSYRLADVRVLGG
jgi:DNA polymerase-3 subunit alpha